MLVDGSRVANDLGVLRLRMLDASSLGLRGFSPIPTKYTTQFVAPYLVVN